VKRSSLRTLVAVLAAVSVVGGRAVAAQLNTPARYWTAKPKGLTTERNGRRMRYVRQWPGSR